MLMEHELPFDHVAIDPADGYLGVVTHKLSEELRTALECGTLLETTKAAEPLVVAGREEAAALFLPSLDSILRKPFSVPKSPELLPFAQPSGVGAWDYDAKGCSEHLPAMAIGNLLDDNSAPPGIFLPECFFGAGGHARIRTA
jgi:hypothetical protein